MAQSMRPSGQDSSNHSQERQRNLEIAPMHFGCPDPNSEGHYPGHQACMLKSPLFFSNLSKDAFENFEE